MTEDSGGKPPKEGGGSAAREGSAKPSSSGAARSAAPALSPGARLGRYEIVELLGTGGMGEVYVARDIRLGRRVALKVLPSFYAENPDRLRRFEREARAASLLNHPNIVAIYDVGSFRNQPYLVTELLEGRTLRAELDSGPFPMERVLRYGIQVARALAAAHERGVIHRDLKPANIFVSGDGSLKLLDFGLAKLVYPDREVAESEDDTVSAPTATLGAIGSSGYMSPEQVQGRPVDNRSDIFSFGILLYEMVSGSSPFRRASTVETLHAIVKDPPAPLETATPSVPASMAAIVRRCLSKRPEDRFHSARDLVFSLQEILGEISGAASGSGGASGARRWPGSSSLDRALRRVTARLRSHSMSALALVCLVVAVLAGALAWLVPLVERSPARTRVAIADLELFRVSSSGQVETIAVISPDGRFVVYDEPEAGMRVLWLQHVDSRSRVRLVEDPKIEALRFSPDGGHIYFMAWDDRALYRIPILGGNPQQIARDLAPLSSLSLAPDGSRIAFLRYDEETRVSSLVVAATDGASERVLSSRPDDRIFLSCTWSPDGSRLLCSASTDAGGRLGMLEVDADTGEQRLRPEVPAVLWPEWLPKGDSLVGTFPEAPHQIWRVEYPSGRASRLTNDLSSYFYPTASRFGGRMAAKRVDTITNLWIVDVDDPENPRQITTGVNTQDGNHGLSATPDGRIVWASGVSSRSVDLWIADADGSDRRRLTFDDSTDERRPSVSPDGRFVVYMRDVEETEAGESGIEIWRMNIDGSGATRLIEAGRVRLPRFTADGQRILFAKWVEDAEYLFEIPAEGGEAHQISERPAYGAAPSPDGRWILVNGTSDESSGFELWPADGEGEVRLLPFGGLAKHWRPDGTGFAFLDGDLAISLYDLGDSEPRRLTTYGAAWGLDWLPDGQTLVFPRRSQSGDAVVIDGL